MADEIDRFENIARRSPQFNESYSGPTSKTHPFGVRGIHPRVSEKTKRLFDDGHYTQATFEALKLIEKEVRQTSGLPESGFKLMMSAFNEDSPKIALTKMCNRSEVDEQQGFKFLFAGVMLAIRNPRGHEVGIAETPDECLKHLSLASLLLGRLDAAQRLTKAVPTTA